MSPICHLCNWLISRRVLATLTGASLPEVQIRLDKDAYTCKVSDFSKKSFLIIIPPQMSDPADRGPFVVMVLDVTIAKPISQELAEFWSMTDQSKVSGHSYKQISLLLFRRSRLFSSPSYSLRCQFNPME
jgi:hypothetical protein